MCYNLLLQHKSDQLSTDLNLKHIITFVYLVFTTQTKPIWLSRVLNLDISYRNKNSDVFARLKLTQTIRKTYGQFIVHICLK